MQITFGRNQKYQIMLAWLCNKYYVLNYMHSSSSTARRFSPTRMQYIDIA